MPSIYVTTSSMTIAGSGVVTSASLTSSVGLRHTTEPLVWVTNSTTGRMDIGTSSGIFGVGKKDLWIVKDVGTLADPPTSTTLYVVAPMTSTTRTSPPFVTSFESYGSKYAEFLRPTVSGSTVTSATDIELRTGGDIYTSGGLYIISGSLDVAALTNSTMRILDGSISIGDGAYPDVPSPSGSVRGVFGLFENDVHGYDGVYATNHLRSYDNAQITPNQLYRSSLNGLVISSMSGGTTDSQMYLYTDQDGGYISFEDDGQTFNGSEQLHISDPTWVRATLGASGRIMTSSTLSASDGLFTGDVFTSSSVVASSRVVSGQTAEPTNGASMQAPSLAVGAGTANSSSYATAGTLFLGTTSGATQNVLGMTTDANAFNFTGQNSGATASQFRFTPASGAASPIMFLVGAGTDKDVAYYFQPTGTGNTTVRFYGRTPTASSGSGVGLINTSMATGLSGSIPVFDITPTAASASSAALNIYVSGTSITNVMMDGRLAVGYTSYPAPASGSYIQTPSLNINSGTEITKHLSASATLDFPSIAAQTTAELTITVTGSASGDTCYASPATGIEANLVWSAYVSGANTVTVRVANITGLAIDPASRSWRADVWQH